MSIMEKKAKGELGPAPDDSIDNGVFGADHEAMNERITALEEDMAAVKSDLAVIRSNYVTKEDLAREIGALRADMNSQNGSLRAEMHREIGALRAEMHDEIGLLRADMYREIGALRSDMAKMETNILKWFIATAVTLAGLAFAAGRFIH
jgi:hypothetical protein